MFAVYCCVGLWFIGVNFGVFVFVFLGLVVLYSLGSFLWLRLWFTLIFDRFNSVVVVYVGFCISFG